MDTGSRDMPCHKAHRYCLLAYSKSKITLSASPCRAAALSAARLRVLFDLEMELLTIDPRLGKIVVGIFATEIQIR
jgi:hypothetical protein